MKKIKNILLPLSIVALCRTAIAMDVTLDAPATLDQRTAAAAADLESTVAARTPARKVLTPKEQAGLNNELFAAIALTNKTQSNTEKIAQLIDQGANLHSRDTIGSTPLSHAASRGNLDTVKLLVSKGSTIDSKMVDGFTPLVYAILNNHTAVAEFLLSKGANINEPFEMFAYGPDTALHFAARQNDLAAVDFLLKNKANVNAKNGEGNTPLQEAVTYYFLSRGRLNNDLAFNVVDKLIAAGANIDAWDRGNKTALQFAQFMATDPKYEATPGRMALFLISKGATR